MDAKFITLCDESYPQSYPQLHTMKRALPRQGTQGC